MAQPGTNLSATVIGGAVLLVIAGAVWFGWGTSSATVPGGGSAPFAVVPTGGAGMMAVHVSGSVVRPGVVHVQSDSRVADVVLAAGGASPDADLGSLNLAATVRDGAHVVVPSSRRAEAGGSVTAPFDINTASVSDLEQLPGVGPVLASRIADYRDAHGPFDTIEDLLGVPGIGEAKLAAIRDAIEQG